MVHSTIDPLRLLFLMNKILCFSYPFFESVRAILLVSGDIVYYDQVSNAMQLENRRFNFQDLKSLYIHQICMSSLSFPKNKLVLRLLTYLQDCPEVHANAADTLSSIARYAPSGLASKISSPRLHRCMCSCFIILSLFWLTLGCHSFTGRLFHLALEDSRPKSVLVNLLSVCISLLDPKRFTSGTYYMYNYQMTHGSATAANPKTVEGMLESLGKVHFAPRYLYF